MKQRPHSACVCPGRASINGGTGISSVRFVDKLRRAVFEELKSYEYDVKRLDIHLFKTDVPQQPEGDMVMRVLEWLHRQSDDKERRGVNLVATYFPDGPSILGEKLDIMIIILATPEVREQVRKQLETFSDPDDHYKQKVTKALFKSMDEGASLPAPSDCVHSSEKTATLLGGVEPVIHIGRPGGVPAVIFNHILAKLQHDLEHLKQITVTPQEADNAHEYIGKAVAFHDSEALRQSAIKDLVDSAIGTKGEWSHANFRPDASWSHNGFVTLFLELKNTLGLAGDAVLQAAVDYAKLISYNEYKPFREYCNFPVVLIGAIANRLEIAVAVSIGRVYVTRLLVLDLSFGFHASDNTIRLARVFKALGQCDDTLRAYYDEIKVSSPPKLLCLYPNPVPVVAGTCLPLVTYRKFLSRAGQPASAVVELGKVNTAMYIATLEESGQEVIVKFTGRYNADAHRLLAKAQLAPKLYCCEPVVGGLFMVVMERVDAPSVWQLRRDKTIPAVVGEKVEEAVSLFHANGLIFGDLRDPNILCLASEDSSKCRVTLVHFDWPGKDGESRYPASLNKSNTWAEEVRGYGIMRKAHDLWQVDRLKGLCSQDV